MSVSHRTRNASADPAATASRRAPAGPPAVSPTGRVPRTRTGAAWLGICTAAVAFVVLIVFMLQNTRSVEVTFLWMHGSVPLALALLIASVGVAILAMAIGAARIAQPRRLSRSTIERAALNSRPTPSDPSQHRSQPAAGSTGGGDGRT